jgi:hypothetical protein
MLNTQKLLYILPDVVYLAELLPGKKDHTFAIQTFRQINGEFLTEDDDFIIENFERLAAKIDPEEYHLILPDFLFTNTIVEIAETADGKIKNYIADKLLPSLEITKDSHAIETFVLTQHKEKSKIQLSAIEKSVLAPLAKVFADRGVTIKGVSSLSWSIKSVISLEPSISVLQLGSHLFTAFHYIGVDQTTQCAVDDISNVAETIKTLKGGEPSIQTVYLLTNELITEKLKELVSGTVPVQQLAVFSEETSQMPSYVKQTIESGMKTLDISEYQAPVFEMPKGDKVMASAVVPAVAAKTPETPEEVEEPAAELPKPASLLTTTPKKEEDEKETPEPPAETETIELEEVSAPVVTKVEPVVATVAAVTAPVVAASSDSVVVPAAATTPVIEPIKSTSSLEGVDMTQFATKDDSVSSIVTPKSPVIESTTTIAPPQSVTTASTTTTPVIKNSASSGTVKTIFVTLGVFFLTIALGVGLGLAILTLTNKGEEEPVSPVVTPSPTSTTSIPSPSPSPSPTSTLKREDLSILVVNATTIPGHAGKVKKQLETAKYKKVVAGNAKGEYEKGIYILQKTASAELKSMIEKDTELKFTAAEGAAVEDPNSEYDAIIVLAE